MGERMEKEKEELTKIAYEAQAYQQQVQVMQQQLSTLQMNIVEIVGCIETLKGLKNVKNKDVFLPIGSGAYVKAKIIDEERILLDIGAGMIAEKAIEESIELLEKKKKNVEKLRDELQQNIKAIGEHIHKLDAEAKKIVSKMRADINVQSAKK